VVSATFGNANVQYFYRDWYEPKAGYTGPDSFTYVAQDGQTGAIKTWFRNPTLGPSPLVSTYDRVLLRNPPLKYQP